MNVHFHILIPDGVFWPGRSPAGFIDSWIDATS
ncbi:MAG: hypothetical protein ACI8S6_001826, partial [Myxococcota bacterium]